jgi:hypothetical protein
MEIQFEPKDGLLWRFSQSHVRCTFDEARGVPINGKKPSRKELPRQWIWGSAPIGRSSYLCNFL